MITIAADLQAGLPGLAAAAVLAHPDWPRLIGASVVPALWLRRTELAGALALQGTTLTSHVYVWETVQRRAEKPRRPAPGR